MTSADAGAAAAWADRGEVFLRALEGELRAELGAVLPQEVDSAMDGLSDLFGDMRAWVEVVGR